MRTFFVRATNRLDNPDFVKRLSRAAFALVMLWFMVLAAYNGIEGNRRLRDAERDEDKLEQALERQRGLTKEALEQIEGVRGDLAVAKSQNEALAEQIRRLGDSPITDTSPNSPGSSSPGASGPPGPQGPPGSEGPQPEPEPESPPRRPPEDKGPPEEPPPDSPLCEITTVLKICEGR